MEGLDSTAGILALAACVAAGLALLAVLSLALRMRRLTAAQRVVLGEDRDRDLVGHAADVERRVEEMSAELERLADAMLGRLDDAEQRLEGTVSKTAVVRYDAFNETSGRQSSSVALLDDGGNGVVISAILRREQARVYAKPLLAGGSPLELSPEEREAMIRARSGRRWDDAGVDDGRDGD